MAAYGMQRFRCKYSPLFYSFFILSLLIPLPMFMFPLFIQARNLGLNNIPGMILIYWGLFSPPASLILHGFIKKIPGETLPLAQYLYFMQFHKEYGPAAAILILSSLPLFIFFLIIRKEIQISLIINF